MEDNKKDEVVEEVTEETTEQPKEEPVKKKTKKVKVDVTKEPEYLALVEENAKLMDQLLRKQADSLKHKDFGSLEFILSIVILFFFLFSRKRNLSFTL